MRTEFLLGDVLKTLRNMAGGSFDAVLSDPPYGIGVFGREWDHGVPSAFVWAEVCRVLKPGGYALIYGGARTYHRLAVAIEEGGFQLVDCLMWLYASGLPKMSYFGEEGTKLGGYSTVLKPAWEPILLARKPPDGKLRKNLGKHGTGALNIDAVRLGTAGLKQTFFVQRGSSRKVMGSKNGFNKDELANYKIRGGGRYPTNVLMDEQVGKMLDQQEPDASRFFFIAKPSPREIGKGNNHPTVKPIRLNAYLASLLLPPDSGHILVPFSGVGSEVIGAEFAGWSAATGIEIDKSYVKIATQRSRFFSAFDNIDNAVRANIPNKGGHTKKDWTPGGKARTKNRERAAQR